jgi:hypothetical protein
MTPGFSNSKANTDLSAAPSKTSVVTSVTDERSPTRALKLLQDYRGAILSISDTMTTEELTVAHPGAIISAVEVARRASKNSWLNIMSSSSLTSAHTESLSMNVVVRSQSYHYTLQHQSQEVHRRQTTTRDEGCHNAFHQSNCNILGKDVVFLQKQCFSTH